jgi:hypothetical protein
VLIGFPAGLPSLEILIDSETGIRSFRKFSRLQKILKWLCWVKEYILEVYLQAQTEQIGSCLWKLTWKNYEENPKKIIHFLPLQFFTKMFTISHILYMIYMEIIKMIKLNILFSKIFVLLLRRFFLENLQFTISPMDHRRWWFTIIC